MHTPSLALFALPLIACVDLSHDIDRPPDRVADVSGGVDPTDVPTDEPFLGGVLADCDPGSAWSAMTELYATTDDSVHELVVCGGAQIGLARSFLARILMSQPEAFDMDEDTKKTLDGFIGSGSGFVRDATGGWMMASSNNGRDVAFTVTFRDGDAAIVVDPLRLDSYFADPYVQVEHSFEEMMADWTLVNTYTFTYSGPGPLAHLLNGGAPLPESFQIHLSLWDFVYVYLGIVRDDVDLDFGPLESLGGVAMDSSGTLDEARDGTTIAYDFAGARATVSDLGSSRSVAFELVGLAAARGALTLDADAADLAYAGNAQGLAGTLRYTVAGGAGGDVIIVDDFGDGAKYPTSTWTCAK